MKEELNKEINKMVRDFAYTIPRPKSEVRSRLLDYRNSILEKVLKILEDEIAVSHTAIRGKTSGLASAYMRIKELTLPIKI